jgi:DNA-binding transcriptional ArsR family regulator
VAGTWVAGTAMTEPNPVFEAVLAELSERHREEVLAAYSALENSADPVHEALLSALRDATLRRSLQDLLNQVGRTLVKADHSHWTSGYRDDVAAQLTSTGWNPLEPIDRAILTLVLLHSVAIPRSAGGLDADTWVSPHPTAPDEIYKHSQLPREEARTALGRLRAAGLVQLDRRRGTGYVPGPQFSRLTPAARRRLQEELILAAGPDTPLAAAVRIRRLHSQGES